MLGDQFLVVGVRRHRHRPGVRDPHRNGAQPDDLAHSEPLGQQSHRRDEPFPPEVGFEAREQEERGADAVMEGVEVELGVFVGREVVGLERHQRAARAVVQQFVDGERGHQFGVERVLEVRCSQLHRRDRRRRTPPARGSSPDRGHRPRQLGRRELQFVHPGGLRLILLLVGRVRVPVRRSVFGHLPRLLDHQCPTCTNAAAARQRFPVQSGRIARHAHLGGDGRRRHVADGVVGRLRPAESAAGTVGGHRPGPGADRRCGRTRPPYRGDIPGRRGHPRLHGVGTALVHRRSGSHGGTLPGRWDRGRLRPGVPGRGRLVGDVAGDGGVPGSALGRRRGSAGRLRDRAGEPGRLGTHRSAGGLRR